MSLTPRHKWMILKINESFNILDDDLSTDEFFNNNVAEIDKFLLSTNFNNIGHTIFFYDCNEDKNNINTTNYVSKNFKLAMSFIVSTKMSNKIVYFIKDNEKPINLKFSQDLTLSFGEVVQKGLLNLLKNTIEKVFNPMLKEKEDWGKVTDIKERNEFLDQTDEFVRHLELQLENLKGDVELKLPTHNFDTYELKPATFQILAQKKELVDECKKVVKNWSSQIRTYLTSQSADTLSNYLADQGPKVEIDFWNRRMLTLQSILDQLRWKPCKGALGVFNAYCNSKDLKDDASASEVLAEWQDTDILLTDALNESSDNVKFLSNLEKYLVQLYKGTPQSITDALPSLLSAMKMIHTLSRHYGTSQRMTSLFSRITNEMVNCCKRHLNNGDKNATTKQMWSQDTSDLITQFKTCIELFTAYQKEYHLTKEKLLTIPKGRQFNFDDIVIFAKFQIFVKRLEKLIDIFSSLQQYQALKDAEVDGMETLMENYGKLLSDFQKKNHDLLEYDNMVFERDFVEFMMKNSEIESELQKFINHSFHQITSINGSLKLLSQFRRILLRQSLSADLDDKFLMIFKQYGVEVQHIEDLYNKECMHPPISRNTPFVSGAIRWSRQLLDRLYEPMKVFTLHPHVFSPKENKKIVKQFNKVAKVLVQFELIHFQEWCKTIERTKLLLQQPLLNRTSTGFEVNFDNSLFALMKESKNLHLLGFKDIPEGANVVLLLEDKLKNYYKELKHLTSKYNELTQVAPELKNLLKPHIQDCDSSFLPGTTSLSWTSLNVDVYLSNISNTLNKFSFFASQVKDIVEHRIQENLNIVEQLNFVSLPALNAVTVDEFANLQQKVISLNSTILAAKNEEIELAVDDLIAIIDSYPLSESIQKSTKAASNSLKHHYSVSLQSSFLACVRNNLGILHTRVTSASSPLFIVDLQLVIPEVRVSPSLASIQNTLTNCVNVILRRSEAVIDWGLTESGDVVQRSNLFAIVSADTEVKQYISLLSNVVEVAQKSVDLVMKKFQPFSWLWLEEPEEAYKKFLVANNNAPNLDSFRIKLAESKDTENSILQLESAATVGALQVNASNLKEQMKTECNRWKLQYCEKLHLQAKGNMEKLSEKMKALMSRLTLEIKDVVTLSSVMDVLAEVRQYQSYIDIEFNLVFDMYNALEKSFPSGAQINIIGKDELDIRSMLKPHWKNILAESDKVMKNINNIKDGYREKICSDVIQLTHDVKSFRSDYLANGPMVQGIEPEAAMTRLNKFSREFEGLDRNEKIFSQGEKLFGLPVTPYKELEDTRRELGLLSSLYGLWKEVIVTIEEYKNVSWSDVTSQIAQMNEVVEKFASKCKNLPKALRNWPAYVELQKTVEEFIEVLPLLTDLSKPSMRKRHWEEIMQLTGKDFKMDQDMKLRTVLEANLLEFKEEIEEIIVCADKQKGIEDKLRDIKETWGKECFEYAPWKDRGDVCLSGGRVGAIIEKLEESQATLSQLLTMKHITPFKVVTDEWYSKLGDVSETLEGWVKVQLMWTSLVAVFTGGDIARQLPQDAKKFSKYDKEWTTRLMVKAKEIGNVVGCCQDQYIKGMLPEIALNLEQCQKALDGYLETKRNKFPRFYFVSNPALLVILSQGTDLTAVQNCFPKVFDSLTNVDFNGNQIVRFKGLQPGFDGIQDSEDIELFKPVVLSPYIEDWLGELEKGMIDTMRKLCLKTSQQCDVVALPEFIRGNCSQFALLGIQFSWTHDVENALKSAGNPKVKGSGNSLVNAARKTAGVFLELANMTTTDIPTKLERTKIETMVTIQVHQRDVLTALQKSWKEGKLLSENTHMDFEWLKQVRFYWNVEDNECEVKVADAMIKYCFEYLGCKERLVITPLTDRCYITLTQALVMFYGGAPAGPAGTGKTETVKDLGRTLGKYVVVFNCSDQMRYTDTAKIYKGLCQSGSWGCFDEFNRIDLEVLSVVAQQVMAILNATRAGASKFSFPDSVEPVMLDMRCGFFITMNPGYAGRVELPENLKALFRGVAMMVPNFEIIIKVKLASCGYNEYDVLSKKFHILYELCKEQLSKQKHYDFGLRNILSVLRTAGSNLRVELLSSSQKGDRSWLEEMILMRTLRDMNLSKLVLDDVELFKSLLRDLFPNQKDPDSKQFPQEQQSMEKIIARDGLVSHPSWVLKVIQLLETSLVRHGLMMVGPAGSGKTKAIDTLLDALTNINSPHKSVRMNPKAITAEEMFGENDKLSGEWTHGIFSSLWNKYNDLTKPHRSWIICDGPVDAVWIENLNTVLDDNKLLTLANGDRIPMTDNVKLLFEVEDLRNASPATVSRAGIVYVSKEDLGWDPIVTAWMTRRRPEESLVLKTFYKKYVDDSNIIDFMAKNLKSVLIVSTVHLITNFLNLVDGLLLKSNENGTVLKEDEMERIVVYSICWALGSLYEEDGRRKFHDFIVKVIGNNAPKFESEQTLFNFFVDPETYKWSVWRPPVWQYPRDSVFRFSSILVPTMDSIRAEYVISAIHALRKSVLVVGSSGTAKTSLILQFTDKFSANMILKKINFSSATTPRMFQLSIDSDIEKKQGRKFAPPGGKLMTVFLDDVSMPEVNKWGDQPTLEIVRQVVADESYYFLEKDKRGDRKTLENIQYIGAMSHPGGGRNDIPNRFKRHFFCFNMPPPSTTSIDNIYGSMLRGRFEKNEDFLELIDQITLSTILVWQKVKAKMLPTPAKFHYIFNMRDLSRVFQGLLHAPVDVLTSTKPFLSLWKHECYRVFSDKLVSNEDKKFFEQSFNQIILEKFGQPIAEEINSETFWCDFMRDDVIDPETDQVIQEAPKIYECVNDIGTLRKRVEMFLSKHNDSPGFKKMDLVLFDDAIRHLIRIARILSMPRGSALLVGVGGSGKQSLTRLAAFIARHTVATITITKNYKVPDLMEDLKQMFIKVGKEGKKLTFIFTDSMILYEEFLEYINAVLATGEVAGLFARDEKDMMASDLRVIAKKEIPGFQDTPENLQKFLLERIRDNFHMVLCFSPMNEKFKERARRFPSLISGCVIDWFLRWPVDALISVASKFIRDPTFAVECEDESIVGNLINLIGNVHETVVKGCTEYFSSYRRYVYVTPKSYLSFIQSYKILYSKKLNHINEQERRVRLGLQKLLGAAQDVENLKLDLAKKKKVLGQAEKAATEFLEKLTISSKEAQAKAEKSSLIQADCEAEASRINAERAVAEKQLAEALPFVVAAESAAKSITKDDISFVTKLGSPVALIKLIMDCVLIILQRGLESVSPVTIEIRKGENISWFDDSYINFAKPMMSDTRFLPDLLFFNECKKDNINDETIELLQPYLDLPAFNPDEAAKKANAARGLCMWVSAMRDYTSASKVVKPRMEALAISQASLDKAMANLNAAMAEKKAAEDIVADLKVAFEKQMAEKVAIANDARSTEMRMEQANELITSLAGERQRWNEDCNIFQDMKRKLVGDCALACAFVSYCGPFNEAFRTKLIQYFVDDCLNKKIPVTTNLALTKFLTDEATVAEWNNQGLPKDDLSIQNGILVTSASRFPLLIDPQAQAIHWIKERESQNMPFFGVTSINNPRFRDFLGYALSEGKPLIIEGIENEVDPMLDPVLEKNVVKKGRSSQISVGDKQYEYHDRFFMYLITKLSNPHFSPELSAKTTVIDFSVTQKGLENQLLSRVLQEEQSALEEQRQNLIKDVNINTINLKNLDALLLERLSASQGNLLEDRALIEVLRDTKTKSQEVKEKIASSFETEIMINKKREQYRVVATRGSIMYFVIVDLQSVNWMYQTALAQFLIWFDASIKDSVKDRLPAKRIANIIDYLSFFIYRNVMRGLFERDKVAFKVMLALRILSVEGKNDTKLSTDLIDLLLKGGAALPPDDHKPFEWLQMGAWLNASQLAMSLDIFRDLTTIIKQNEKAWKAWYMESAPELSPLPVFDDRFVGHPIGKYLRWLLVRSLRDDRAVNAASEFIAEALGPQYVEPLTVTLEAIWTDSNSFTPIVLLLSPGADPTSELAQLARKKKVEIRAVSMGEGQEPNAKKAIETAAVNGDFALLQNCHLGLGFMAKLIDVLAAVAETNPDPNWRLWITCEPHPSFPISVLQRSIKVTNEPPQGLKAGLLRSFTTMVDQDRLNRHENNQTWKGLVFGICFLHSCVQERRKFGSIGWNIPYEFNNGDLDASLTFLERHIQQYKNNVQWTTLQYMVCEVQYGGRITDDFDRVLFNTYGESWLGDNVIKENFIFSDVGCVYKVPKSFMIEDIRNYINSFPASDSPEVFGLHPNADLTFGTQQGMYMLATIQSTQPKESGSSGGLTRDEQVRQTAEQIMTQLPPSYDMDSVRREIKTRPKAEIEQLFGKNAGKMDASNVPLNVFLFQEIERLNYTIRNVSKTLNELQAAIRGETIMTPDLQEALDLIYFAKPPKAWYTAPAGDLIAWVATSLAIWINGLIERDRQLRSWLSSGRPTSFWLTGFFNPQGFLTAMKQEVTRKHAAEKWALDDMQLHAEVTEFEDVKRIKTSPDEGVYVHGLFLDGCQWDRSKKSLVESAPKELYTNLPVLWITALTSEKKKQVLGNKMFYECPIYTQPKRTGLHFVTKVPIRTDKDKTHWTLRGVALLCDT